MHRVLPLLAAVLFQFQPVRAARFLGRAVIAARTTRALEPNELAHAGVSSIRRAADCRRLAASWIGQPITAKSSSPRRNRPFGRLRGWRNADFPPWRSACRPEA